ncbi:MAG: MBL fold metallo-hydrolase [Syntrophales bacterium]|nr:MBL fold metallo-hydrolase [Syntrophales bacterium]
MGGGLFNAFLVNDPFGDPAMYLEFKHQRRAFLFDLGDIHNLPARKVLKIDAVFVSHTHMDHFIGFDHLVRICLGRDRNIILFGPSGFLKQVENRLGAYSWNLVEEYENNFVLKVVEVHPDGLVEEGHFECKTKFRREGESKRYTSGILIDEDLFSVHCAFLDHKIPSLAFCFEEKKHVNIKKNVIQDMGFSVGPWLNTLKEHIFRDSPDDLLIRAWWKEKDEVKEIFVPLGELRSKAVKITPGRRVAYVTDVLFSKENVERIVHLAKDADVLFIETTFLQEDVHRAQATYHLTAHQAGEIARLAGAKRIVPFHFSPKYKGSEHLLIEEATRSFSSEA